MAETRGKTPKQARVHLWQNNWVYANWVPRSTEYNVPSYWWQIILSCTNCLCTQHLPLSVFLRNHTAIIMANGIPIKYRQRRTTIAIIRPVEMYNLFIVRSCTIHCQAQHDFHRISVQQIRGGKQLRMSWSERIYTQKLCILHCTMATPCTMFLAVVQWGISMLFEQGTSTNEYVLRETLRGHLSTLCRLFTH